MYIDNPLTTVENDRTMVPEANAVPNTLQDTPAPTPRRDETRDGGGHATAICGLELTEFYDF